MHTHASRRNGRKVAGDHGILWRRCNERCACDLTISPLPKAQQAAADFRQRKGLFDETWTRRALEIGPPNAVIPILFGGKGLWPFQNLMWLAHIARAVSRFPTVRRPLRELIGSRTKATLFELEVAAWFVEQGWEIEFLKPSNDRRSPDIRIQKGALCSSIECKRFDVRHALHSTPPTSISVPGLANIRFEPGTDKDGLHAIDGGEVRHRRRCGGS